MSGSAPAGTPPDGSRWQDVFAAGGAMGAAIAGHDWAATPLGPIDVWPQSLRTARGTIRLALTDDDGRIRLTVSDTGVAISADELPRLFQRFHRVSGPAGRSAEGSGIGLALVRELVDLHGGQIEMASAEDDQALVVIRHTG